MAALLFGHYCHSKSRSPIQKFRKRNSSKIFILLSCQNGEPVKDSGTKRKKDKAGKQMLLKFFHGFEKFGKGLKKNLSPQQKGDWKDLVLMSLSFAVYVYISQMLVCAYSAWVSMPKQSW
ncbi:putative RNA/RNP complex-1-interacting phosphatase [Quillaja saponaria]|uniref:RNA/RNP complex-1-interacting phosphatase n=1 Tax=Quillaja saponaria TaxID=32244 RepID=A0AAD7QIY6_QUISA|nr:putative RNA/RNP complex-1-interacting phosphatase [Quillaja saponaria]